MPNRLKLPRPPKRRWSRRFLRRLPPPAPPGWHTGPPDFVGVGAQRSGSSWWYRVAVEAHPKVVRVEGRLKELHYFDRFWNAKVPSDFAQGYHSYFPRPANSITGEWTPRYMYDHWSMRLLAQAAPETRILVILRDPIERFRSGLEGRRRLGVTRGRKLDEIATAVSRGAYTDQLRRIFDFFPRERVLVLQYERCRADPVAEIARTWRFLGLEPAPEGLEPREPVRAPSRKLDLPPGVRDDLVARLARDVEQVALLCPEIDLSLWPNFSLDHPGSAAREGSPETG